MPLGSNRTKIMDKETVKVPRELLENLIENTIELRGVRDWWKDEPRCNYQQDYQRYCVEIEKAEEILNREMNRNHKGVS